MFIYHARTFYSASIGARVVEVVCEKCGCEYYYELARVGSGATTAHYGIGSGKASKRAAEEAGQDLDRRLMEEAELVPCPKCLWINDDLVSGYRRGRCRGWVTSATAIGIVGSALSLVVAWFLSIGPAPDRGSVPYVLIGGPLIASTLAASVIGLRSLLLSRIQPNRDYPLPPRLPEGSPIPYLRNPDTGELEPVAQPPRPEGEAGAWTDFQIGRILLPTVCCECLGSVNPRFAFRRPLQRAVQIVVPMCQPCAVRWRRWRWLGALVALTLTMGVDLPLLYFLQADEVTWWFLLGVSTCVSPIIGAMIAGRLAAPVRVKIVDSVRGVIRLKFRNEEYLKQSVGRREASAEVPPQ